MELTAEDQRRLESLASRVGAAAEFSSGALEAVQDGWLAKTVGSWAPWLGAAGTAFAEVVPLVKFAAKLLEEVGKEPDPAKLAYIACSVAYRTSVAQSLQAAAQPKNAGQIEKDTRAYIDALQGSKTLDFSRFSLGNALSHEFVQEADVAFGAFAKAEGYTDAQRRRLMGAIHSRFVSHLKTLLSHGTLRERFAPLRERLQLGTGEHQAYESLLEHADYQRWLFEEAPVLGNQPYSLRDVYVDMECGRLIWGEINQDTTPAEPSARPKRVDPFSEAAGGRQSVLGTVFSYLGDPSFTEAIVVQGVAGSGKSTLTLCLATALVEQGLRPIRVRLRDLRFDKPLLEALAEAVQFTDEVRGTQQLSRPDSLFLDGKIFRERVSFGQAEICPYVLILDGWDEINISVSEGFKIRVEKMLDQLRNEFLRGASPGVRVILTGRPSADVTDSLFLRTKTPILTLRPLEPERLESLVVLLRSATERRPLRVENADDWIVPDVTRFRSVFERYRADFEELQRRAKKQSEGPEERTSSGRNPALGTSGSMDVVGLPLLAHIAIRLMSQWPGEIDQIVENPTTLYRSLVDLTCKKGGQLDQSGLDPEGRARVVGSRLRPLLRKTAAAMTALGEESISHAELALRLQVQDVEAERAEAAKESELAALMISFYFKGGHRDLGCEFVHKSFREYLFAEGIVESLKDFARTSGIQDPLPERTPYWREFDEADPRFRLTRVLSELLAPQWLSSEVAAHVMELLAWEIQRSAELGAVPSAGAPTAPLELDGWRRVRDALADVWDWWGEGVHMRPQPTFDRTRVAGFSRCYAEALVELAVPLDRPRNWLPQPDRTITVDAHLGDAIFRLTAAVHFQLACKLGWQVRLDQVLTGAVKPKDLWSDVRSGPRKCQRTVPLEGGSVEVFAPTGRSPRFFENLVARINAAGWRPAGDFPLDCDCRGLFLAGVSLHIRIPQVEPVGRCRWDFSNLEGADCNGSLFYQHSLVGVLMRGANVWHGMFLKASLLYADLSEGRFRSASFRDAELTRAQFHSAQLFLADFDGARLSYADFHGAYAVRAIFVNASLYQADLTGALLKGADFHDADIRSAILAGVEGADFEGALRTDEEVLARAKNPNGT